MNKRCFNVVYEVTKTIEFDDEEMLEYGYEGKITEEDRAEYLETLMNDEYDLGVPYTTCTVTRDCVKENLIKE